MFSSGYGPSSESGTYIAINLIDEWTISVNPPPPIAWATAGGLVRPRKEIDMPLIVTVLVGVVSALFASSASAQVINACVNNVTGFVRIVSDPNDCRPPDSPISWNVQGPAGPMGEPGAMGEPGKGLDVGEVVRIELPATSGFDTLWFVPSGKALLVDHIIWSNAWGANDPMEVTIRHFQNKAGGHFDTTISSATGFRSFDRPLVLPAQTGLEAPSLGDDPNNFPRAVYVYGRLVDADSALLSGTD